MRRILSGVKDRDMRNCGQGKEKVPMTKHIVSISDMARDYILDLNEEV